MREPNLRTGTAEEPHKSDSRLRLMVCGDREWTQVLPIRRRVEALLMAHGADSMVLIHGGCRGADSIADAVAREFGVPVEEYPADWGRYGRAAGPVRNQQMIDEGRPDLALAFHPEIERSKGTADMVERARKAGVPVEVVCW